MLMFIIFILIAVACFGVIPAAYVFFLGFIFKFTNTVNPIDQRHMMNRINQVITVIFGIAIIQCFYIGVFANPEAYPNYAQYLLYGMILAIILIVCYIIIQAKRAFSKNWPINEIQEAERNE